MLNEAMCILQLHNCVCSSTATTPPTTTPLPRLDTDAELYASEITKTSAKVSWRSFTDYELQYIDGVQVKYTQKNNLVWKRFNISLANIKLDIDLFILLSNVGLI